MGIALLPVLNRADCNPTGPKTGTDPIPPARRGWKAEPGEEDSEMAVIYTLLPLLYGFLNSAPATINVVNVEIISIFWRQAVIYPSHFSGAGSHAVKSSDCQLSADWGSGCNLNRDLTTN